MSKYNKGFIKTFVIAILYKKFIFNLLTSLQFENIRANILSEFYNESLVKIQYDLMKQYISGILHRASHSS